MIYRVLSRSEFNGYRHGQQFEARLDPGMEARALSRGVIEVLDDSLPSLQAGTFRLPKTTDVVETEERDAYSDSDQGRRRHRT